MKVKDLIGFLQDIPDDYEVTADDGRYGMESGGSVDGIVVIKTYKKICMLIDLENTEEEAIRPSKIKQAQLREKLVKQLLDHDNELRTVEPDTAYECGKKHAKQVIPVSE